MRSGACAPTSCGRASQSSPRLQGSSSRHDANDRSAHASGRLHDSSARATWWAPPPVELVRNPNEMLMLEALFVRLSALSEA